jgi:predicted helicase
MAAIPERIDKEIFQEFVNAGFELMNLHVNYETFSSQAEVLVEGEESGNFRVDKKIKLLQKPELVVKLNSQIAIRNIDAKAMLYTVQGRTPIEWIVDQYQCKTHKDSGIHVDPNDWAEEVGNPRYILDLILSVIHVSTQTVDIVNSLPEIDFD